ncbi:DUF6415 family natural product biosynthesis protein [Streptomyces sp. NPDC007148]|uniref:DUF6415 family natural product biosynthesis protein n=1 Tax=Streptomyces sp. NPDC007148 TaxID=3364775 RepID=UPI0036C45433
MTTPDKPDVDTATIRETYSAGLNVWTTCLPDPEELELLRCTLAGHVGLLVPEVTDVAARMRGEIRRTAVHVIVRAHQVLEDGAGADPVARACHVQDLAVTSRALLNLYCNPGPLGSPTGHEEIEESVRRKVCGACSKPIADGDRYERAVFAADSSGGIRGYRHTGACPASQQTSNPCSARTRRARR